MPIHNTRGKQLGAWLFAGLSAPLAQLAGGMTWQTVAVVAFVCLGVSYLVQRTGTIPGQWLSIVQLLWLVWVISEVCGWISGSWSAGDVYPAVPLILLGLGAASAWQGPENAGRAGSVVFWLLALIYSVVLVAGAGQVELRGLCNAEKGVNMHLVVVLLLPALSLYLPEYGKKLPVRAAVGIWGFAVLISGLITGGLSTAVALESEMPLHDWVEGLSIAGTLQRFESVVSVALTMGWFALLSFLLSVAGRLAQRTKNGSYTKGIWWTAVAAGGVTLVGVKNEPIVIVGICVVLWVIMPLLAAYNFGNKNSQNL